MNFRKCHFNIYEFGFIGKLQSYVRKCKNLNFLKSRHMYLLLYWVNIYAILIVISPETIWPYSLPLCLESTHSKALCEMYDFWINLWSTDIFFLCFLIFNNAKFSVSLTFSHKYLPPRVPCSGVYQIRVIILNYIFFKNLPKTPSTAGQNVQ